MPRIHFLAVSLSAVLLSIAARPAGACTAFLLQGKDQILVGKSYDWDTGDGLVMFNKQKVAKRALILVPGVKPAEWVSKHSSLTFNQYGREFPVGGMNQAGLVVETLWLESSEHPAADPKPAVNELQWVQYLLDTAGTTAEAVERAQAVNVLRVYGKAHYLVCDRAAACATFEYLRGRLTIRQGQELPVPVLTNHTYEESLAFLKKHKGFGGATKLPATQGSLARFARAASLLKGTAAFEILERVEIQDYTKWQIVYDPVHLTVAFKTAASGQEKRIDLAAFDPSCQTPVPALDIDFTPAAPGPAEVAKEFTPCTPEKNRGLLERSLKPIAAKLPPGAIDALTAYPDRLPCTTK